MLDHTPFFPKNLENYAPWVATHGLLAPYGKCQCGCGNDAPFSRVNDIRWGHAKEEPVRFIRGHYAHIQPIQPTIERFWKYVDKRGPNDCWEWKGARRVQNYGGLALEDHKVVLAHRFSYELHYGPIPESEGYHGTCVLHRCDNPPCVNPKHLFLGTNQDNVDDKVSKGRGVSTRGNQNGMAKLNPEKIVDIRQRYKDGESFKSIAYSYDVTDAAIRSVVQRKTWRHIP